MVEVRDGEEGGGAFAGGRREDRRIGQDEPLAVEEVADAVDNLVPHPQDRRLPAAADPEVAPVEQVVDAVFLGRDGVVAGLAHDLEGRYVDLVAARGPRVLPYGSLDDQ